MPPVPRRQARTSSPPDLPRTAGSALRTQQVSARTQGAALHPPASLPEDKATSAAWLGSLSPPRKHRRRRMSRRRGPGRCSTCCRLGSVLQQCQCSLPGHLRGRGGGPLTSSEAHPVPTTFQSSSPKGTNPKHLQLPKVRCFRSHSLPLRKCTGQQARELSGELALEGEAPRAVSAMCFLLPDCAMPSSEAGQTGDGGQHAEGCCLADQRVQHGTPLFSCRTGSPG